jgi:hypothetical protein
MPKKELSPVEERERAGEIVYDKEELGEFLAEHDRAVQREEEDGRS